MAVLRVLPDPATQGATVSRYVWLWRENGDAVLGWPYSTEEEARRIGRPPVTRAVLLELVLPVDEIKAALQAEAALQ